MWRGGLGAAYLFAGPFVPRCLTSRTMPRFHRPLIEPDVRISRIRLSDEVHNLAHDAAPRPRLRQAVKTFPGPPDWAKEVTGNMATLRPLVPSTPSSKSGPFPPPALPGFSGTTNLSATPWRPTCPSRAFGWSSLTTPWGFPCCVRFPCVHAVATTPAQRLGVLFALLHPAVSAFPERVVGSACALSFSRLARRSLALRPAHSRCHQFVVTRILVV